MARTRRAVLALAVVLAVALTLLPVCSHAVLHEWRQLWNHTVGVSMRPTPREGVTMVHSSNRLIVFGGGNSSSSEVWSLALDTSGEGSGVWTRRTVTFSAATLSALPAASSGHASISTGSAMVTAQANTGITVVLDLDTWVWRRGYNVPFLGNSFGFAYSPDVPLAYLVGGRSELGVPVDPLYSYAPDLDTGPLGSSPWDFIDRPPTNAWMERRYAPAVAMCASSALYIFGGKLFGTPQYPDSSLYRLNPATLNMTLLLEPLSPQPQARWGATMLCWEPYLFLFGGLDDSDPAVPVYLNDVWRHDLRTNLWELITPSTGAQPPARALHACDVGTMFLYCFAGRSESGAPLNDLWSFQYTVPGPSIVSFVASDPDNGDDLFSVGDLLTITFSEATNQPSVVDSAAVNALLTFSTSIGAVYAGVWRTAVVLEITVTDVTGAVGTNAPDIGTLTCTVRASGGLRDAALSSLASTASSSPITGDWGVPEGPRPVAFIAQDTRGIDAVRSDGDVLLLVFDKATSQPAVATAANLAALLSFSDSLGTNYTGSWTDAFTLRIVLGSVTGAQVAIGSTTALCTSGIVNAARTSRPCDERSPVLSGNWGTLAGPAVVALVADDPDDADGVFSNDDTLTLRFAAPTSAPSVGSKPELDALLVFPLSLGADYVGAWSPNSSTLVITIRDVTGADATALNALAFALNFSATALPGVTNAAATSLPVRGATPTVSGNWGLKTAPAITELVANDPDDADALYSVGDTVLVVFSEPTNTPSIATRAAVDAVFNMSTLLAANYTGEWLTTASALITVRTALAPAAAPAIGGLRLSVRATAELRSLPPFSVVSTAVSPLLSGDWGLLAGPAIAAFVAADPDNLDGVFSAGDTLTVLFAEPTNQPAAATKAQIDALLAFDVSLGSAYTGVWLNSSALRVTIGTVTGHGSPTIGTLTVRLIGTLYNAALTSLRSLAVSPVLAGSWGTRAGPAISSFTAAGSAADGYYNVGDTLTLVFAEPTNTPAVGSRTALDALLAFSQSLGTDYTGQWTDQSTLRLTVVSAVGATPPAIGVLTATVIGPLRNAADNSLDSRAVSPPLVGSFGSGPTCAAASCASCALLAGCGWCHASASCEVGSASGALYQPCSGWDFGSCTSCNSSSCSACVANSRCGFCATASGSYTCDFGAASGPYVGTCSGIWHAGVCPTARVLGNTGRRNTSEAGGATTVTLQLTAQPVADVLVPLVSSDASEGALNTSFLLFAAASWNSTLGVLVTGLDDLDDDGDVAYALTFGALQSTDLTFAGATLSAVPLLNVDNDVSALVFGPPTANTSESGLTAAVALALASRPAGTVTVALSSANTAEAVVLTSPATVEFTPSNWATAQFVLVGGVDDARADGPVAWSLVGTVTAASADPSYLALAPTSRVLYNVDDDVAALVVTAASSWTTEAGARALFTVALASEPLVSVTSIPLIIGDSSELAIPSNAPSLLVFTTSNWATPQTVTVAGVDDFIVDGNVSATVTVGPAVLGEPAYRALSVPVPVLNLDDDVLGVITTALSANTSERGASALFTVRLGSVPCCSVTMQLASSDTTEATVSPTALTFTAANWRTAQAVTVFGVDDTVTDGAQPFTIAIGSLAGDPDYAAVVVAPVAGFNEDDDVPALVSPSAGFSGFTSETGSTATLSVRLQAQPVAPVLVTASIAAADEAELVSIASVTFTATDWATPFTFTARGVDDSLPDGPQPYTLVLVASSADLGYNGLSVSFNNTNVDDDVAALVVTALASPPFHVSETGTVTSLGVALSAQPSAPVNVTVRSLNTAEGVVLVGWVELSPASWATPQPVLVRGVDDAIDDGTVAFTVSFGPAMSADASFAGLRANASLTNEDNGDRAALVLSALTASAQVTETGSTATFTVSLGSQPIVIAPARVAVPLVASEPTRVTLSPTVLYFDAASWATPQTVTVTGRSNDIADGAHVVALTAGPTTATGDAKYTGLTAATAVTVLDDDVAGLVLTTAPGATSEAGPGLTTLAFRLSSEPLFDVVVTVSSGDTSEGLLVEPLTSAIVSSYQVIIVTYTWAQPVAVTIAGVDDSLADGDVSYSISIGPLTSGDASYDGLAGLAVPVVNVNDDFADVQLWAETGVVPEAAAALVSPLGDSLVWLVLRSQPTAPVSVPVALVGVTHASVLAPTVLTFTATNWATPQSVRLRAIDNVDYDGAVGVVAVYGPTSSADAPFSDRVGNVTLWSVDDEAPAIVLRNTPAVIGNVSEAGTTALALFALGARPSAAVTVPISIASPRPNEATAAPSSLVFTSANWFIPQTVTITGRDDAVTDGAQRLTLFAGGASSTDAFFNARFAGPYELFNLDDDVVAVNVVTARSPLVLRESGAAASTSQATFTLALTLAPLADVTVPLALSDPTEAVLGTSAIVFTPGTWALARTVTVLAADDTVVDGLVASSVVLGALVSTDTRFAGLVPSPVALVTLDDDGAWAGAAVQASAPSSSSLTSESGTSVSFSVLPTAEPTAPVSATAVSTDSSEGIVVTGASVAFGPGAAYTPATVTVRGVDDSVDDGTVAYGVVLSLSSAPSAGAAATVALANADNGDAASIALALVRASGDGLDATRLVVSEAGRADSFTVTLGSQPEALVSVPLGAAPLAGEVTFSPSTVVFSAASWAIPQTVVVVGAADGVTDGDVAFTVTAGPAISSDAKFAGLAAPALTGLNLDSVPPVVVTVTPMVLPTSGGVLTVTGVGFVGGLGMAIEALETRTGTRRSGAGAGAGAGAAFSASVFDARAVTAVSSRASSNATLYCGGETVAAGACVVVFSSELALFNAPPMAAGAYTLAVTLPDGARATLSPVRYTDDCPTAGTVGTAGNCRTCPTGGVCPGGNVIIAQAGYWTPDSASGEALACFPRGRCVGGTGEVCAPGYRGALCGGCAPGATPAGHLCEPCESTPAVVVRWVVYVLFWLGFVLCCVVLDHDTHAQVVWLVLTIGLARAAGGGVTSGVHSSERTMFSVLALASLDFEFVLPGCSSSLGPRAVTVFFGTLLSAVALAITTGLVLWVLARANWRGLAEHYARRLTRSLLAVGLVSYWSLAKVAMQGVTCVTVGSRTVLLAQQSLECYTSEHNAIAAFAYPLWLYLVGFPLVLGWTLFHLQGRLDQPSVAGRLGVVYELADVSWFAYALVHLAVLAALSIGAYMLARIAVLKFVLMELALLALVGVLAHRPFDRLWQSAASAAVVMTALVVVVVNFMAWDSFALAARVMTGFSVLALLLVLAALAAYVVALVVHARSRYAGGLWSLAARIAYARGAGVGSANSRKVADLDVVYVPSNAGAPGPHSHSGAGAGAGAGSGPASDGFNSYVVVAQPVTSVGSSAASLPALAATASAVAAGPVSAPMPSFAAQQAPFTPTRPVNQRLAAQDDEPEYEYDGSSVLSDLDPEFSDEHGPLRGAPGARFVLNLAHTQAALEHAYAAPGPATAHVTTPAAATTRPFGAPVPSGGRLPPLGARALEPPRAGVSADALGSGGAMAIGTGPLARRRKDRPAASLH